MKHAAPVRRAIRKRTIFNLLGPLANPAGATRQVLGVSRPAHVNLLAEALGRPRAEHAWVVHGAGGLCDLSIAGPTEVAEVRGGHVRHFTITPADAGLTPAPVDALLVDSPSASAAVVRAVLSGERGPCRDHALLNTAGGPVVADLVADVRAGVVQAGRGLTAAPARASWLALVECSCR